MYGRYNNGKRDAAHTMNSLESYCHPSLRDGGTSLLRPACVLWLVCPFRWCESRVRRVRVTEGVVGSSLVDAQVILHNVRKPHVMNGTVRLVEFVGKSPRNPNHLVCLRMDC